MKSNQIFLLLSVLFYTINANGQTSKQRNRIDSMLVAVSAEATDNIQLDKLFYLAKSYHRINKDSTQYYISQTMQLAQLKDKKALLGKAYYYKGWLEKSERNYTKAVSSLDTSILYLTTAKDTVTLANCLSDYGLSHWRLGHLDKSITAYNKILSFNDTPILKKSKLAATINSALVLEEQDMPAKAEERYLQALAFAIDIKDRYGQIIVYNNLSSIYRHRIEYQKSIENSYKGINLARKIGHQFELRRAIANLGATYTQMNKNDSALYCLNKAFQIAIDINEESYNVKTSWHLAELYINMKRYNKARQYGKLSLSLAKKYDIIEDIAFGYEILYQIEQKTKNYALSNQLADSLLFWRDSLNKSSNQEALADAEASYNNTLLLKDNTIQASKIESLAKEKKYLRIILLIAILLSCIILFAIWNLFKKKKVQSELAMEMEHTVKLTENVEAYRKKRATELHDDVGQDLLLAQQSIQLNNPTDRTKQFIERALNKVRKISKDEYPYELNYIGLKASLEYLIDLIEQNTEIIISESLVNIPEEIPETQMLNIYRVIQEMLNNSIKNKDTTAVFIGMETKEGYLEIVYQDNGTGFDFEENLTKGKSIGLKSIVNRVRMLKAELKFVPSTTDNRYQIIIPFDK